MRYFDSGVLVKLYCREPNSPQAIDYVFEVPPPAQLTPLHVVEVRSAIRQKRGRKDITVTDLDVALASFERDLKIGFFDAITPAWEEVFNEVERISAAHTETTLCRSLDALHVAMARILGANEFCTFDKRQATLAQATGLSVVC